MGAAPAGGSTAGRFGPPGIVEALVEALDVQLAVAGRLDGPQLARPSPCAGWSVRDVLAHSVGVTRKFADFAAGATDRPRTPDGDLLGPDPLGALRHAAEVARRSWAAADLDRPCHLPFGTFPASVAAGINLFDVLAHTWDVAQPAGLVVSCRDELWDAGLAAARTVVGPSRDAAHYGPELPARPTDPPAVRFLRFLGRDPGPPAGA